MPDGADTPTEPSRHGADDVPSGPCVRCGSRATRSCFLLSARSGGGAVPGGIVDGDAGVPIDDQDIEIETFFACERCIDRLIGQRRYVGIAAGGILLFLGLLLLVTTYDEMQAVGLALALAGLVWGGWAILDTHDARGDSTVRIAKEEAVSRSSRRYWTREEFEADFERPAVAGRLPGPSDR